LVVVSRRSPERTGGNVLACAAACVLIAAGAAAGDKGTPDEAKALLDKAVAAMQADEAKAIAAFNDAKGGYVDRDLYVFCFKDGGDITAHRDPGMVGKNAAALKDPEGKAIGAEMVALAGKGGGSVEYKWENPVTRQVGAKISFLKKAGSQTCGVGAYK
jgi:signal transduction histidine kinase